MNLLRRAKRDPVYFVEKVIGFDTSPNKLHAKQKQALRGTHPTLCLPWGGNRAPLTPSSHSATVVSACRDAPLHRRGSFDENHTNRGCA